MFHSLDAIRRTYLPADYRRDAQDFTIAGLVHLEAEHDPADFPEFQIVINHTGLPADRSAEGLATWRRALEQAAGHPNVALKISGLGQPGRPWRVADNGPVVRDAIAIFGVERRLFASNFPVDSLVAADLATIFSGFREITADLGAAAQTKLFHDNAARIYRLFPIVA